MKSKKMATVLVALGLATFATNSIAAGDIDNGKKLAKKCKACHTLDKGAKNKLGPNLYGIINKPAGRTDGYNYSEAMLSSGITWNEETFFEYISKPKNMVAETKMSYKGIDSPELRRDLVAYFKTLSVAYEEKSFSNGNANRGFEVAAKNCVSCHSFVKGGEPLSAPNLFGIHGKQAGKIEDYAYSIQLKNSGLTWDNATLAGFLADPEAYVTGSKSVFPGLKSTQDIADVMAYMKTLK